MLGHRNLSLFAAVVMASILLLGCSATDEIDIDATVNARVEATQQASQFDQTSQ